jgi:hypothetical protein
MILEAMDLLRVEAALLRAQLPELVLRAGMTLPARVMERAGRFGVLLLAGTPLSAELPDELRPGDRLRSARSTCDSCSSRAAPGSKSRWARPRARPRSACGPPPASSAGR